MASAGQHGALLLARLLVAAVFLFSGFVKAVDPLGTAYKIQDYMMAADLDALLGLALPLSFILNTFEFVLGAAILLGTFRKSTAWATLIFMLVMTPATFYIALTDPVPDCGCFGDAIIITNWETFFKNLVLLVVAGFVWWNWRNPSLAPAARYRYTLLFAVTAGITGLSVYGWIDLPIIDFRPWHIGQHVPSALEPGTPPTVERTFIYTHRETGETQAIPEEVIMGGTTPDASVWQFARRQEQMLDPGEPAAIDPFSMHDENGDDVTGLYVLQSGLVLFIAAYDLHRTDVEAFANRIRPLVTEVVDAGHVVAFLTATAHDDAQAFAARIGLSQPFYQVDERAIKTMIRSTPGLVLLKDGVVIGKWPARRIPTFTAMIRTATAPIVFCTAPYRAQNEW